MNSLLLQADKCIDHEQYLSFFLSHTLSGTRRQLGTVHPSYQWRGLPQGRQGQGRGDPRLMRAAEQ